MISVMIQPPLGRVRIANRWFDDHYIHIENQFVEVGVIDPGWRSALWNIVPVGGGPYVRIINQLQSPCCLQSVNGELHFGERAEEDSQSHWYVEPVKGSDFCKLRPRISVDHYLHFEDRTLQLGAIDPAWWSAQWRLQHA